MSITAGAPPADTRVRVLAGAGVLFLSAALVGVVLTRAEAGGGADPPPALPEGESFAFITGVDASGLLVDLAEMLSGEEARRAAIEDGVILEGEDLPNDFYIRNHAMTSWLSTLGEEAVYTVLTFDADGQIVESEISHSSLRALWDDPEQAADVYGFAPDSFPVTLTVEDGLITGLAQVYLP